MRAYRGHLIHVGGAPQLSQARDHLVSAPDGVLVIDDAGMINYSERLLPQTLARIDVEDTDRLLFTLLTGMREDTVAQVYVKGRRLDDAGPGA